ncbi:MAG TPA: MmcQ/YjbR family DNA-binding protein [Actinomycetes bacterium]|nr:MmcQ/YjbR family DNA-binding protein [Actinomycetes bacterium]
MSRTWTEADCLDVRKRLVSALEALPETAHEDSHGHTGLLCRGKRFAWLTVDHHGDGRLALWVKAPPGEQAALVGGDPVRYFVPPYVGPSGWVGVLLDPGSDPDWDEVAALVEQGWRMSATKRAIAAYDAAR